MVESEKKGATFGDHLPLNIRRCQQSHHLFWVTTFHIWRYWRRTNSSVKVFIPWTHQSGSISCCQSSAEVAQQQGAAPGVTVVRSRAALDLERLCLCAGSAAQGRLGAGSRLHDSRFRHQGSITKPILNTSVTVAQTPSQGEQTRIHQASQVKPILCRARFLQ